MLTRIQRGIARDILVMFGLSLFVLTLDMAKDGRIAACGVWIANAIFVLLSIVMMRKTIYSPV
ncbi:hypothetical protein [Novipirellula sp.]|uniref:hypothetical protein n=1 Tax=Novipirellula sp. TaxID=2795430 RepID=UPI0035641272